MDIQDRVVLITGAAKRVGRAVALGLARRGAALAIHYRHSADDAEQLAAQLRESGGAGELFQADLSDVRQIRGLVPQVVARMGRLDVLINNASIFEETPFESMSLQRWHDHLQINVTAPMLLAQAAWPELRRHGIAKIVNLLDITVARPWRSHVAYAVSKGALHTLTLALARVMAPQVQVNGVAPGVAEWPDYYDEPTKQRILDRIPLRRAGRPEDIARAVEYLVCEADYVTGQVINVDGGRSIN